MRTQRRVIGRSAALVAALAASLMDAQAAPAEPGQRILDGIARYRGETWAWQRLMEKPRSAPTRRPEGPPNADYYRRVLKLWRSRAVRLRREARSLPRLDAWLCIHRHEGPWRANTGNGYYGGLQMSREFQRRYGRELVRRKGLAHRWLPIEQVWIAERAHRRGRGFRPWVNAARACGLL